MPIPPFSGFLAVLRFELEAIAGDRRFALGLVLQVAIVALLVPLLIDYAEKLGSGGDVLATRADGFAPVAVWGRGNSSLEKALSEESRVRLDRVASEDEARKGLQSGRYCMILGVPPSPQQNVLVIVNRGDPRSISAWEAFHLICEAYRVTYRESLVRNALVGRLRNGSTAAIEDPAGQVELLLDSYLEPIDLRIMSPETARLPDGESTRAGNESASTNSQGAAAGPSNGFGGDADNPGDSGFLSLVFLAFGLCFPLFSGSGMMVESITCEKERRTLEAVLASPTSRIWILLGKCVSAFLVSAVQSLALLLILGGAAGVRNVPAVAFCLLVAGMAVLSSATLVSVLCKGSKEASLAITILYVLIFVLFFGPLMLPGRLAFISPLTPMVRFAAGEPAESATALVLLCTVLFSGLCVAVSLALFSRDDVVFGPRPSLRGLLTDVVSGRIRTFRSRAVLVCTMGALASLPAILFPSLFVLPSIAFLGRWGFVAAIVFAALVEEYFKPYGVYLLPTGLTSREVLVLGGIAGLSFSLIENLLFTLALLGSGALQGSLLLVRYLLAPMMHVGLTMIVVAGYSRGRYARYLALSAASSIHGLYNLAAALVVM